MELVKEIQQSATSFYIRVTPSTRTKGLAYLDTFGFKAAHSGSSLLSHSGFSNCKTIIIYGGASNNRC